MVAPSSAATGPAKSAIPRAAQTACFVIVIVFPFLLPCSQVVRPVSGPAVACIVLKRGRPAQRPIAVQSIQDILEKVVGVLEADAEAPHRPRLLPRHHAADRKSAVSGKSGAVRVEPGG